LPFLLTKELPGDGRELEHPGVFQTIKDLLGGSSGIHNLFVPEQIQVLGDAGLGSVDQPLQFLHRVLTLPQKVDDE